MAVKVIPLRSSLEAAQAARELALLGRLEVEGLVRFHEAIGLDGDPPAVAIVVDHVAGGTLAAAVAARGHLSVGESVTVLVPVARALAGLHAVGVVHADVSPANVLLESSGRPLVSDLGLARFVGEAPADIHREAHGTPGFVAPEVLGGAEPTPASDVYAVGALAWWCVTGAPLERGYGPEPRDADLTGVPESWRIATEFALSPDPQLRPSATELALAYFDSAPCEPLRLVVGADDTSLLTQRLRRPDEVGDSGRTTSSPSPRRSGGSRWWRWRERPRRPRRLRWPWLVVGGVIAASATGVMVARPWAATPVDAQPTVITAPRRSSGVLPTSSPRRQAPSGDLVANQDSPRRDPRGLMQALADRRALVMVHGRTEELAALDVAGSAALRTDTTLLTDLRDRGRSYRDVVFVVRQARTLSFKAQDSDAQGSDAQPSDAQVATIEAVVDTAAYKVVDRSVAATHAPTAAGPMRFSLRWQEQRWKIERVSAG